jgi:hypothetical protein
MIHSRESVHYAEQMPKCRASMPVRRSSLWEQRRQAIAELPINKSTANVYKYALATTRRGHSRDPYRDSTGVPQ